MTKEAYEQLTKRNNQLREENASLNKSLERTKQSFGNLLAFTTKAMTILKTLAENLAEGEFKTHVLGFIEGYEQMGKPKEKQKPKIHIP